MMSEWLQVVGVEAALLSTPLLRCYWRLTLNYAKHSNLWLIIIHTRRWSLVLSVGREPWSSYWCSLTCFSQFFSAKNRKGEITTLGRSGSDYTAAILGAAVSAREIEIWTDVNGILTTDPGLVPGAKTVEVLTFQEAAELAFFGAKVLHPGTIAPAMAMDIPVRIANSFNPTAPGTVVVSKLERGPEHLVTAITMKRNVHLVDIISTRMLGAHGFLAKVFQVFSDLHLSVDVIATSEVSVSLTLERHTELQKVGQAMDALKQYAEILLKSDMAILTIIGNSQRMSRLLSTAFGVLDNAHIPVEMVSCGASKGNISLVVPDSECERAVKELHADTFSNTPISTLSRQKE
eukprot:GHVN01071157.1.p1 GENE.GHVN01071157.1~~GHVN01071157.1.p1  ORF type:complete len:348 (-),score=38.32 GHVN01071157.1:131-1174(-)